MHKRSDWRDGIRESRRALDAGEECRDYDTNEHTYISHIQGVLTQDCVERIMCDATELSMFVSGGLSCDERIAIPPS